MTLIGSITDVITSFVEAIFDIVVAGATSLASVFYVAETGLTLWGVLALIGLGLSIVFFLINWVRSFIK